MIRKEETRQDGIEDLRPDNKEQKNNPVHPEHLEEHILPVENDDKSHLISENDENNIQDSPEDIEENVLFTEKNK